MMTEKEYIHIHSNVLNGNTQVLKDVIRRYRNSCLMKLCKQHQCRLEDAEEFFQDAILAWVQRLYKGKFEFHNENSIRVFLEKVCVHKFLTQYQKEKRRKELLPQIFPSNEDFVAYQVDSDEEKDALKCEAMYLALESLKENCRNTLRMFYFGGERLAKIAELLGYSDEKSAGIVKNRCRNYWFKKSIEVYKKLKKD